MRIVRFIVCTLGACFLQVSISSSGSWNNLPSQYLGHYVQLNVTGYHLGDSVRICLKDGTVTTKDLNGTRAWGVRHRHVRVWALHDPRDPINQRLNMPEIVTDFDKDLSGVSQVVELRHGSAPRLFNRVRLERLARRDEQNEAEVASAERELVKARALQRASTP
ncbi:MAG: hypothetical protein HY092_00090 [Candidatus Kerfeldbacteria bacterium]|nr:hypothetical protein [Candidatus Kerfeldbacteria bacterium]